MEGKEQPCGKLKNMEPECDPLEKGNHLYTTELYLWVPVSIVVVFGDQQNSILGDNLRSNIP